MSVFNDGTARLGLGLALTLIVTGVYTGFGLIYLLAASELSLGVLPALVEAD